ncbi:MAG: hypothetical protein JW732_00585 [Dehalococcoidia bacterium]|nr:hypothetical protein [Dehalococcoidia bacterium]
MPNLRHLLDDLEELGVEPQRIRIPGRLYDNMVADAEESIEENPEDEDSDNWIWRPVVLRIYREQNRR